MNGVTGRLKYRRHLVRSILAIREQGGRVLGGGRVLWPVPILVGRGAHKLKELPDRHGLAVWTTSLDQALAHPLAEVYFDTQVTTGPRGRGVQRRRPGQAVPARAAQAQAAGRRRLLRSDPLGAWRVRLLGVRGRLAGRPAPFWNYRAQDGGGMILDMFPHWRYVLDSIAPVRSVYAHTATHIPQRVDERRDGHHR